MQAVTINQAWCKGCGICVAFCPKGALRLEREKAVHDPDRCVHCGLCEMYCPDLAVEAKTSAKKDRQEGGA